MSLQPESFRVEGGQPVLTLRVVTQLSPAAAARVDAIVSAMIASQTNPTALLEVVRDGHLLTLTREEQDMIAIRLSQLPRDQIARMRLFFTDQ